MSDNATKRPTPTEAQPLKPLPMPEYAYQREQPSSFGSPAQIKQIKAQANNQSLDLSGVVLNLG